MNQIDLGFEYFVFRKRGDVTKYLRLRVGRPSWVMNFEKATAWETRGGAETVAKSSGGRVVHLTQSKGKP